MADDLQQYLRDKRELVDQHLCDMLQPHEGSPAALIEAMRYSVLAPGKRLRPILTILAAEAAGGRDAGAVPAGCAVEMIHAYSLIHDDLPAMDDDDLRRGQPTCHKQFGEAMAILAGDALLTLAFQTLTGHYPPATAAAACLELARGAGVAGMVGGQVEDLKWSAEGGAPSAKRENTTLGILENIHRRKTGALIRSSIRLGVLTAQGERVGGPEATVMESLDAYARCVGLAFQITDDLLDIAGSTEGAGKRVGKDAKQGKLTYPGVLGMEESRRRAAQLCQEAGECLKPLGRAGDRLAALAAMLIERKQ